MSILDILKEDAFERETIDPVHARQTEVNFYRGAPPVWFNFYLAEQNTDETHPSRFIKRDGYDELYDRITDKKLGEFRYVRLNHKPGCGGTTLAMQLLWDLRKSFRCAVLVDSTLESSEIATAVIDLYAAGEPNDHKTVLLLVQGGNVHTLLESFVTEFSKRKINSDKAVVVILHCVRIDHINAEHSVKVNLVDQLTDNEAELFNRKEKWHKEKYTKKNVGIMPWNNAKPEFHGFNIMQSNFSQEYVKQAWDACRPPVSHQGLKFTACLCLLNSYVPGSFVLKSHCEKFLKTDIDDSTFEETIRPFCHLMVSFNTNEQQVLRMAHPMIAEQGRQIFHAVMNRTVMARILLEELCTEEYTLYLAPFIKDLLTKRQNSNYAENKFSRLILDIKKLTENGKETCLLVLKEAVKKFPRIASYPQTLSRFYYLEMADYSKALTWAKRAIQTAPNNSFIADTLGQVYKHQLKREVKEKIDPATFPKIFYLAKKAFEAFEHGENLAEKEKKMVDGLRQESTIFNFRPKSAFLQVANTLSDWEEKKNLVKDLVKATSVQNQIPFLPDEIKVRARFINMLLSYSQKSFNEKDPDYVLKDARTCYQYYTGEALPEGLGTGPTEEQICLLHKTWQNDTQEPQLNLKMMVEDIKSSFHETHEKHFRSRHLKPLLYLESSDGNKVRVHGEVRCYKVYTTVGDEEIQLDVDNPHRALWRSGEVNFDLGFTIKGPTACDIQFQDLDEEAITGVLLG